MPSPVRRFYNSLFTRFLITCVLVVGVGSFVRYQFLSIWFRHDIQSLVLGEREALAKNVARSIEEQLLDNRQQLARLAAQLPKLPLAPSAALSAWLRERQGLLPFYSEGLAIIDEQGKVVAHTFDNLTNAQLASLVALAREQAQQGDAPVLPVLKDWGVPSLGVVVPLGGEAGSGPRRGVLVGAGALTGLHLVEQRPADLSTMQGGLLLVSPRDQLFVSSSDPSMVLRRTPAHGVNQLHDRAMEGYRGTGITVNARGVEEFAAMASVPSANWFVVARIPSAVAYAPVSQIKGWVIRGSIIALVVVSGLIVLLILWAVRPLFNAVRQAEAMTRGDIPLQPMKVVRDDEVGQLTSAFNRLLLKLAATQAELCQLAHHDALTGLPNRRLLADRLSQSIARAQRHRTQLALMVLDLDGFKRINDDLGHEAGDEALRIVAQRLGQTLRRCDTLARTGGDEFVLLASDLAGSLDDARAAAEAIARKCIAVLNEPFLVMGRTARLGVSIGIATGSGDAPPDELHLGADQAMYRAKQQGGMRYEHALRAEWRGATTSDDRTVCVET